MTQFFALLSLVFKIAFVLVFDSVHHKRRNRRFWTSALLSPEEVDRIRRILAACEESQPEISSRD